MRLIDVNLLNVVIILAVVKLGNWLLTIIAARWPNKLTTVLAS